MILARICLAVVASSVVIDGRDDDKDDMLVAMRRAPRRLEKFVFN